MADFELRIDEKGFENRGIRVDFDENLYGELLDERPLVEGVAPLPPLVQVAPARSWGRSDFTRAFQAHAGMEDALPGVTYDERSKQVTLRASEDVTRTNANLLYGTRRLLAHVSGETYEAARRNYEHRHLRRAALLGSTGVGAATGLSVGGGEGAFIGAVVGSIAGMTGVIADYQTNPKYREWVRFAKDPDVLAKYGRIIQYA